MISMEGKVALITGAGNGLGFEYAKSLAKLGAYVIINDLGGSGDGSGADTSVAKVAVEQIREAGGKASANTADVADTEQVQEMIDEAFAVNGHLDVLICNAGILRDRMVFNISVEEWDVVQRVHLRGHFLPLHFASQRWRANAKAAGSDPKPASVVLTTSRSGLYCNPGQVNYAAAKAGIAAMAIIGARELARYGVRVNAIAPIAKTRLTEGTFGEIKSTRWNPENVAPMVTFLASEESLGISGQVFIVGGGKVEWMQSWTPRSAIEAPADRGLTLEDILTRRNELFGDEPTTPATFPTATWD